MPHEHRHIRSLAILDQGRPGFFGYDEGPAGDGQVRLDLLYTGLSAGTELTFLKGTNPYLHSRWDDIAGRFVPGEPSARFPVNFLGYMESARVIDARAPGWRNGQVVGTAFGHKTGHTADPSHDLLTALPDGMDPMLGIFVGQMGPIAANGILHADAEAFGAAVPHLGASLDGRPALIWGGGTVGLFCALFAQAAGASEVVVVDPSPFRQDIIRKLGMTPMDEDAAVAHAKSAWHDRHGGRGVEVVFQTRAHSDSLHRALAALRPQGTVIDLAFYQGGLPDLRLGEEFHHNGLRLICAQINRMPRRLAADWNQRRLAAETVRLLERMGPAIRQHLITHVVPFDEAPRFLERLVAERFDFLQVVFAT